MASNGRAYYAREDDCRICLLFENEGTGPATDIRVTLRATIDFLEYLGPGPFPCDAETSWTGTTGVDLDAHPVFSYIPAAAKRIWYLPYDYNSAEGEQIDTLTVERFIIFFNDLFGNEYTVQYPDFSKEPTRFERTMPKSLWPARRR
jgi:hypothetical protein